MELINFIGKTMPYLPLVDHKGVVLFVHAKGKSERVPGKALQTLGDKPLVRWALDAALAADLGPVVLDSDSEAVLAAANHTKAYQCLRPGQLAWADVTGDHLAGYQARLVPSASMIVQVVPTCPFTRPETIRAAVDAVLSGGYTSAVAVTRQAQYRWRHGVPAYYATRDQGRDEIQNSQEMDLIACETTGLYAVERRWAAEKVRRLHPVEAHHVEVSPVEAIDINTPDDLALARLVAFGLEAQLLCRL